MRVAARGLLALCALVVGARAHAQVGDGPRSYFYVPPGTNVAGLWGLFQDGNASLDPATAIEGARISVDVGVLQFNRAFALAGQTSGWFVALPLGEARATATFPTPLGQATLRQDSRGAGDLVLGAVIGLSGSPSLTPQAYARYNPGLGTGLLFKLTAPTGSYSASQPVNLGANRWAVQMGPVIGWYGARSMLDPAMLTLELIPSITLYAPNDAPFRADRRTQAPLLKLEGHVTRNLRNFLWVSLDMVAIAGGETRTDGRDDRNTRTSLALGGTAAMHFSRQHSAKVSWGRVVARNDAGLDGEMLRVSLGYAF